VIATAEQQLETAGGIEDTPFVTITVTIDAADSTKRIVSAYQVLLTSYYVNYPRDEFLKNTVLVCHKSIYFNLSA
jgi:hypothetical protein